MTNFKVGDKVKIIGNSACSCNNVGDIGIITDTSEVLSKVKVALDLKGNWSCNVDLELITDDVPIGYRGLPKNMNLKTGDVVKGIEKYYTIKNESVGDFSIENCGGAYTLVSRAITDDNPWTLLTDKYTVSGYTNDIAYFDGVGVAYRKKAPVVRTIEVFIHTEGVRIGVKATVVTKDDVIDWSTLKVKENK